MRDRPRTVLFQAYFYQSYPISLPKANILVPLNSTLTRANQKARFTQPLRGKYELHSETINHPISTVTKQSIGDWDIRFQFHGRRSPDGTASISYIRFGMGGKTKNPTPKTCITHVFRDSFPRMGGLQYMACPREIQHLRLQSFVVHPSFTQTQSNLYDV